MNASLPAALASIGLDPDGKLLARLERFGQWLEEEALPAGGLGPAEVSRIHSRHLVDALLFGWGWQQAGASPDRVLDLGCGVGLPGIPLAIAFPEIGFVLVDRAGRRVRLARRAVRVLELENVKVVQGEMEALDITVPVAVSRASLPPAALRAVLEQVLERGGVGVVGGSAERNGGIEGYIEVWPPEILDRRRPLLIMVRP